MGRLGVGGARRAGRRAAAGGLDRRGDRGRSRRLPHGRHGAARQAHLGHRGELEGRHRRLQRELPRGPPAHHLAAGRQGRPVQHVLRVRPERHDGDPVQGRAAGAEPDPRPPGPGHLPLHDLPDLGVQQQPGPPPAVPRGPDRGRPDPVRDLGAVVPGRRRRVPDQDRRPLGAAQGRGGRGRGDLHRSGRPRAGPPPTRGTCSTTASARSLISTASCRTCSTPTPTIDRDGPGPWLLHTT